MEEVQRNISISTGFDFKGFGAKMQDIHEKQKLMVESLQSPTKRKSK
jgi:hypothetical protein